MRPYVAGAPTRPNRSRSTMPCPTPTPRRNVQEGSRRSCARLHGSHAGMAIATSPTRSHGSCTTHEWRTCGSQPPSSTARRWPRAPRARVPAASRSSRRPNRGARPRLRVCRGRMARAGCRCAGAGIPTRSPLVTEAHSTAIATSRGAGQGRRTHLVSRRRWLPLLPSRVLHHPRGALSRRWTPSRSSRARPCPSTGATSDRSDLPVSTSSASSGPGSAVPVRGVAKGSCVS